MTALLRRLYAIFLRQIYLTIRSVPRFLTQIFWPTINVVIWGFLNQHLYAQNQLVDFTLATLLGATLLNNFFERSNINTMFAFLEDVWARNLGNMVITPIRPLEMMAGYILTGLVNVLIGVGTACILSYVMFDYSLWDMGNGVVPFLVSLIMSGWCIGIILICMIIRYGVTGELLGWMLAFLFIPFVAVYYPVSILPQWMQYISWVLPPTYIFESLREYISTGKINWHNVQISFMLNISYLVLLTGIFVYSLNSARRRGGLLSMDAS